MKDALSLKAKVARLRQLLAEAGVESGRWRPMALRRELARALDVIRRQDPTQERDQTPSR